MKIKINRTVIAIMGGVTLFSVAFWLGGRWHNKTIAAVKQNSVTATSKSNIGKSNPAPVAATIWTCSMHPQIRKKQPGKCPICGMTLIPLKTDDKESGNGAKLTLSPQARRLAEVATVPVKRDLVTVQIRMVGKIDFVESKVNYITARMPGRIDKLFVDYTGIAVKKNDHMAEYFSPDLMVAQKELLIVMKNRLGKSPAELAKLPEYEKRMYASVMDKFTNWGLTKRNIDRIIRSGKVNNRMVLYAPVSGIVIQKNALEGKYFKTGDRLFTVADLSSVWIMLDAYESDLMWLRYGQKVTFTTVAYPGETFTGRISFIDPMLDNKTRTVKVRVDADNRHGKLKPGMFVNAIVKAQVAKGGKVIDPALAGKWLGPMHPEIIRDQPGRCPICGMKLVKAESLGYHSTVKPQELPLVIPVTAPLITGKRAVVYLQAKNSPGTFYGKEIILGPRAGNYYIVKSGLKEGDLVVTNGNFKIDSALQIQAKPSMMTAVKPTVKIQSQSQVNASFIRQLNMIYNSYLAMQRALAADKFTAARDALNRLGRMLKHISTRDLGQSHRQGWQKVAVSLTRLVKQGTKADNLQQLREIFANLTAVIDTMRQRFGTTPDLTLIKFKCPMAFGNRGAIWFQKEKKTANPYLGQTMPECGEQLTGQQK